MRSKGKRDETEVNLLSFTVGSRAAIGFGSVLAIVLSWTTHHAIGWAVIHGLFSWFYVVYFLITQDGWTWF